MQTRQASFPVRPLRVELSREENPVYPTSIPILLALILIPYTSPAYIQQLPTYLPTYLQPRPIISRQHRGLHPEPGAGRGPASRRRVRRARARARADRPPQTSSTSTSTSPSTAIRRRREVGACLQDNRILSGRRLSVHRRDTPSAHPIARRDLREYHTVAHTTGGACHPRESSLSHPRSHRASRARHAPIAYPLALTRVTRSRLYPLFTAVIVAAAAAVVSPLSASSSSSLAQREGLCALVCYRAFPGIVRQQVSRTLSRSPARLSVYTCVRAVLFFVHSHQRSIVCTCVCVCVCVRACVFLAILPRDSPARLSVFSQSPRSFGSRDDNRDDSPARYDLAALLRTRSRAGRISAGLRESDRSSIFF